MKKILIALLSLTLFVPSLSFAERVTPSVTQDVAGFLTSTAQTSLHYVDITCTPNSQIAQLTADTASVCPGFALIEDSAGVSDSTADAQGSIYFRLRPGSDGVSVAAGDGIGLSFGTAFLKSATNTPAIEAVARQGAIQNATTSLVFIGFADTTGVSPDYAAQPNGCMFVASSTAANWIAVCQNSTNYSQVNTGIASSSALTGTGSYHKFRVSMGAQSAAFYIQGTSTDMVNVANISGMSVASTTALNPIASVAKATAAGLASELQVRSLRVLYADPLW